MSRQCHVDHGNLRLGYIKVSQPVSRRRSPGGSLGWPLQAARHVNTGGRECCLTDVCSHHLRERRERLAIGSAAARVTPVDRVDKDEVGRGARGREREGDVGRGLILSKHPDCDCFRSRFRNRSRRRPVEDAVHCGAVRGADLKPRRPCHDLIDVRSRATLHTNRAFVLDRVGAVVVREPMSGIDGTCERARLCVRTRMHDIERHLR